jgi:hypothetical protein
MEQSSSSTFKSALDPLNQPTNYGHNFLGSRLGFEDENKYDESDPEIIILTKPLNKEDYEHLNNAYEYLSKIQETEKLLEYVRDEKEDVKEIIFYAEELMMLYTKLGKEMSYILMGEQVSAPYLRNLLKKEKIKEKN